MLRKYHSRHFVTAKVKAYIGRDQFGFMAGRGTRDAIALLRVISEKAIDHYMNQTASVMIDGELSDPSLIGRGVRQGGLLSTILYNIYAEFMITEALENNSDGIKIGGELVAAR